MILCKGGPWDGRRIPLQGLSVGVALFTPPAVFKPADPEKMLEVRSGFYTLMRVWPETPDDGEHGYCYYWPGHPDMQDPGRN